ncbi:hypothetical protein QTP88_023987 [Uroleucon formosanum]
MLQIEINETRNIAILDEISTEGPSELDDITVNKVLICTHVKSSAEFNATKNSYEFTFYVFVDYRLPLTTDHHPHTGIPISESGWQRMEMDWNLWKA